MKGMKGECVSACNKEYWRQALDESNDKLVSERLEWVQNYYEDKEDKAFGPPYGRKHHDWVTLRAMVVREARRRGLSLAITGLGT